jgi:protein SCO1/2
MNQRLRIDVVLISVLLLLTLGGCGQKPYSYHGETVEPPAPAPDFTLTGPDGKTLKLSDFRGKVVALYFGYTFCPDVCPTDLQTIGQALRQFEKDAPRQAARLQPIFITVDPARDTPAVLKSYVSAFHPRLLGLTGTDAQIAAVEKEFAIYAARRPTGHGNDYFMDHSRQALLLGPKGEPIALLPQDEGPKALEASLEQWVK